MPKYLATSGAFTVAQDRDLDALLDCLTSSWDAAQDEVVIWRVDGMTLLAATVATDAAGNPVVWRRDSLTRPASLARDGWETIPAFLCEALNAGGGVYRP